MNKEPTLNPTKWMYIGQLKHGQEALQAFDRGIQLMLQEKKNLEAKKQVNKNIFL